VTRDGPTVFVGDELTLGGNWESWFPHLEVLNLAVRGETSDGLVSRHNKLSELQPGTLVIHTGTHDIEQRRSVEDIVRNIEYLLVALRRNLPHSHFLVHSILPRETPFATKLADVNRHLRQFCPSLKAQFLDLWPEFVGDDGHIRAEFSDDQIHPNARGYAAWVALLRPALEDIEDRRMSVRRVAMMGR